MIVGAAQGVGCLPERDESDVFFAAVREERPHAAESQRDGRWRVVPLVDHPDQPAVEAVVPQVLEGHVGAFDALGLGAIGEEALQADPVGLDRLG